MQYCVPPTCWWVRRLTWAIPFLRLKTIEAQSVLLGILTKAYVNRGTPESCRQVYFAIVQV